MLRGDFRSFPWSAFCASRRPRSGRAHRVSPTTTEKTPPPASLLSYNFRGGLGKHLQWAAKVASPNGYHELQRTSDVIRHSWYSMRVGVDHIKDSYRLLTKRTPLTDVLMSFVRSGKKQNIELSYGQRLIKSTSEPQRHEISSPLSPNKSDC